MDTYRPQTSPSNFRNVSASGRRIWRHMSLDFFTRGFHARTGRYCCRALTFASARLLFPITARSPADGHWLHFTADGRAGRRAESTTNTTLRYLNEHRCHRNYGAEPLALFIFLWTILTNNVLTSNVRRWLMSDDEVSCFGTHEDGGYLFNSIVPLKFTENSETA